MPPFNHPDPSSAFTTSTVRQAVKNPNQSARPNSTDHKTRNYKLAFMNKGG
jgi:hypothetical protein